MHHLIFGVFQLMRPLEIIGKWYEEEYSFMASSMLYRSQLLYPYCEACVRSVRSSDKFNRLNNSIRRKSINHYTRLFQLYPNMTWLRTFFIRFPVPASSVPHQSHKRRNKFVLISSSKTSGLSMFSVCARSKHVPIPASPEHADNTRFLPTFGQETRCFALKATLFLFTRF